VDTTHNNLFYVDDKEFENKVLKSDMPVIVDFWAGWCRPCLAMAPVFEQLSNEYVGTLKFAKMDVDANPNTPGRLRVEGIPTLIIFHSGKAIGRLVGALPAQRLKMEIGRVLSENGLAVA
jgi:thioredoxin 1